MEYDAALALRRKGKGYAERRPKFKRRKRLTKKKKKAFSGIDEDVRIGLRKEDTTIPERPSRSPGGDHPKIGWHRTGVGKEEGRDRRTSRGKRDKDPKIEEEKEGGLMDQEGRDSNSRDARG